MATPKIVILGAGYGGIITALNLQKKLNYNEADVTLVSKHDYHYITTHLHMPAAGTDDPENARVDIDRIIDTHKIRFIKGLVSAIKPDDKFVTLEDGQELSFDYLVIGLGSNPETFGIPGLKEHAFLGWTINTARLLRQHIEYQFALYKQDGKQEHLTFVVGGAGFTGIEFIGELADRIPALCKEHDIDPSLVRIVNIEAAPTALPGFDPELVEYAMEVLKKKGVEFKIATAIKECTAEGVIMATEEEIKSSTIIWTGGVRGNKLVEESGIETMRGRVKVDSYLHAPGYDNIYVVGDCSLIFNDQGRPFPPTAQIATQQGVVCANNLISSIRGSDSLETFSPEIKGTVASLGRGEAIGIVGKRKLYGSTAAMMKKVIDARYLYMIGGIPLVLRKSKF
jgi:NADH dehydrogenase